MTSHVFHINNSSRRIIALLCLIVCANIGMAMAQARIPREVHLGVKGGAMLSQYSFHPRVSQRFTGSYSMGVAARYIEEEYFGLQAELLISDRGFADLYDPNPDGWLFERKLTYIELPVLAHVYFPLGKRNEISIDLGPKIAWFLGDRVNSSLPADFNSLVNVYKHHELPISKKFDYGIQLGLGYEFKINQKLSAQLSGSFYFGLGNLWPDTKADDFEESKVNSIQISFGLWWRHVIKGKKVK